MECKNCGHISPDGSNFCINCGVRLTPVVFTPREHDKGKRNGLATASMVLGIISAFFGVVCCFGYVGVGLAIISGIMAIIFSVMTWNSKSKNKSIAGLVCGIIGVIFGILIFFVLLYNKELQEYLKQYQNDSFQYGIIIKAII